MELLSLDDSPQWQQQCQQEQSLLAQESLRWLAQQQPRSCILTIRPGAGGKDAADWALELLGAYMKLAERHNWKVETLDLVSTDEGGIRRVSLRIHSQWASLLLSGESGVHRVAHHSKWGKSGKRQTSMAAVEWLPWQDAPSVNINEKDVDTTAYAGSSKGGQHANKSSTNIRMTHRPTGISATSSGRSQGANRAAAWAVLCARVEARILTEQAGSPTARIDAGFGGWIRSYTQTPYQVIIHPKWDFKSKNLDVFLKGHMDELLLAGVIHRYAQ